MEESGRLSRSSVGSNGSGGTLGRPSQQAAFAPVERRLVLTQDDRELMDMFRSQGKLKTISEIITPYIPTFERLTRYLVI